MAVPLLLPQEEGVSVVVTIGIFPLKVMVTVWVVEQPPASVTITVQVPADNPVAVEVVCPLHHE